MEQGYTKDALALLKKSLTGKNSKEKSLSFLQIITPYANTDRDNEKKGAAKVATKVTEKLLKMGGQKNQLLGMFTVQLIEEFQVAWEKLSVAEQTDQRFLELAQPILIWLYCVFNICLEKDKMEKFKGGAFLGVLIYAAANALLDPLSAEILTLAKARNTRDPNKQPNLEERKKLLAKFQSTLAPFINAQSRTQLDTFKSLYLAVVVNEDETFRATLTNALRLYAKLYGQTEPSESTLKEFSAAVGNCDSQQQELLKQLRTVESSLPTLREIGKRLVSFSEALEKYTAVDKEQIRQKNLGLAQSLVSRATKPEISETEILYNLRAWGLLLGAFLDKTNQGQFKFRPFFLSGVAGALDCQLKTDRTEAMKSLKAKIDAILAQHKITPEFQTVLYPLAVALLNKETKKQTRATLLEAFNLILESLRTNEVNELKDFAAEYATVLAPYKLFQLKPECETVGALFPQSVISSKGIAKVMSRQGQFKQAKPQRTSLSAEETPAVTPAPVAAPKTDTAAQQKIKDANNTLDGFLDDINEINVNHPPVPAAQPPVLNKVAEEDSADVEEEKSEDDSSEVTAARPQAARAPQPTVVANASVSHSDEDEEEYSNESEHGTEEEPDSLEEKIAAALNGKDTTVKSLQELILRSRKRIAEEEKSNTEERRIPSPGRK